MAGGKVTAIAFLIMFIVVCSGSASNNRRCNSLCGHCSERGGHCKLLKSGKHFATASVKTCLNTQLSYCHACVDLVIGPAI
ncbi:hypothetical protein MKX01_027358 [Papaver californicum]|nr:hypothetical protein MKX01_027358 [Papaver californicum]